MISKNVIVLIFLVSLASCQIYDFGPCPKDQVPSALDITRLIGKWYQLARVENGQTKGEKCVTYDFLPNTTHDAGHPVVQKSFDESGQLEFYDIGNLEFWPTYITFEYGKISYSLNIETDYENYAILFGCTETLPLGWLAPYLIVRIRTAVILTRSPTIDSALRAKVLPLLESNGIGQYRLTFPKSQNCPANY